MSSQFPQDGEGAGERPPLDGERPPLDAPRFAAHLGDLVAEALRAGVNPFLVIASLETAKLDVYNMLQRQQREAKRTEIVRSSFLPGNGRLPLR